MDNSPDIIKDILQAIQQLPAWQWLESQMAAAEAEGFQGGTDTVGDVMPQQPPELPERFAHRDRVYYSRGFATPGWAGRK